jgi:hypothetical protein
VKFSFSTSSNNSNNKCHIKHVVFNRVSKYRSRLKEVLSRFILAKKNDSVDIWNEIVQNINPEQHIHQLASHDYLCDVDDPFGYLASCINEDVLNTFNANGVPKHILKLKVNDICIVTRSLKTSEIATNSRVRIISISSRVIKAELLNDSKRIVLIPRIRFKFKLAYGESYQMMICQIPIRLAYCTIHKQLMKNS